MAALSISRVAREAWRLTSDYAASHRKNFTIQALAIIITAVALRFAAGDLQGAQADVMKWFYSIVASPIVLTVVYYALAFIIAPYSLMADEILASRQEIADAAATFNRGSADVNAAIDAGKGQIADAVELIEVALQRLAAEQAQAQEQSKEVALYVRDKRLEAFATYLDRFEADLAHQVAEMTLGFDREQTSDVRLAVVRAIEEYNAIDKRALGGAHFPWIDASDVDTFSSSVGAVRAAVAKLRQQNQTERDALWRY